jgi:hypothetical protein
VHDQINLKAVDADSTARSYQNPDFISNYPFGNACDLRVIQAGADTIVRLDADGDGDGTPIGSSDWTTRMVRKGYFSHTAGDGSDDRERVARTGYRATA